MSKTSLSIFFYLFIFLQNRAWQRQRVHVIIFISLSSGKITRFDDLVVVLFKQNVNTPTPSIQVEVYFWFSLVQLDHLEKSDYHLVHSDELR